MKWVRILGFLLSVGVITLLTHCSSSSPAPSVIDGKWTYTTADGKMKVTFELTSSSTGTLEIKNPASITVNGASGNGAAQISGASVPNIASIVINANDAALTYSHVISFSNCIFSGTTNKISVTSGSYTIFSAGNSGGTTTTFSSVSIVRP